MQVSPYGALAVELMFRNELHHRNDRRQMRRIDAAGLSLCFLAHDIRLRTTLWMDTVLARRGFCHTDFAMYPSAGPLCGYMSAGR